MRLAINHGLTPLTVILQPAPPSLEICFSDSSRITAAKYDFAMAQDTWASTWPSDVDQRAFRM